MKLQCCKVLMNFNATKNRIYNQVRLNAIGKRLRLGLHREQLNSQNNSGYLPWPPHTTPHPMHLHDAT